VIYWMSGLSGAGKTVIAHAMKEKLIKIGKSPYILDGDVLRMGLCSDLEYDIPHRKENLRRAAEVAAIVAKAGHDVICAFMTPTEACRTTVAEVLSERVIIPEASPAVFVGIGTSLEVCMKRDAKGLYARYKKGKLKDMPGLDAPFTHMLAIERQHLKSYGIHAVQYRDMPDWSPEKHAEMIISRTEGPTFDI